MTDNVLPGVLNGHIIGILLKEAVRRALAAIRQQILTFEVQDKLVEYKSDPHDIVTSADLAAQQVICRLLRGCFPEYGIIAEEEGLRVPCQVQGREIYLTIDAIDGTKAWARRQSDSVATMIALVVDGEVVAVAIGDVMSQEVYYYRPGGRCPHRITELNLGEDLVAPAPDLSLREQYIQIRENPIHLSPALALLCRSAKHDPHGLFRDLEVRGGSIGCQFARLWKREVGGLYLDATDTTPWDFAPVLGISQQLGYEFLAVTEEPAGPWRLGIAPYSARFSPEIQRLPNLLVVHETRVPEVMAWLHDR